MNIRSMLLSLVTLTAVTSFQSAAWAAQSSESFMPVFAHIPLTTPAPVTQLADATPNIVTDAIEADISRNLNRLRQLMNPDIAARIDAISNLEIRHFLTQGWASWYGPGFQGEPTASGEIYDQNAMTAAHKFLPFGTRVRVTNLDNGLSAVVRINDRGPYIEDREIDLSEAAAQILGTVQSGVVPVRLELLD